MNASYATLIAPRTVRIERLLPGPIERVWSFLTDSELRGRWLASGAMDREQDGAVELVFRNSGLTEGDIAPPAKYAEHAEESRLHGRILACEPPSLLVYTWGDKPDASEVRFELSVQGDEVRLLLTHSRLPNRGEILSVAGGWHTHLGILSDRLAGREPPGFWATIAQLETEYEKRIPADA